MAAMISACRVRRGVGVGVRVASDALVTWVVASEVYVVRIEGAKTYPMLWCWYRVPNPSSLLAL